MSTSHCEVEVDNTIMLKVKLISEIRKRPILWKYPREPKDKNEVTRQWSEVCENVVPNWGRMDELQRRHEEFQLKTKWRNIKDYFSKELNKRTSRKSLNRKYIFYEHLQFLIPILQKEPKNTVDKEKPKLKPETKSTKAKPIVTTVKVEETPVVYDEDISFTRMLVPMLNELNYEQKHFAKIEILNVLRLARINHFPNTSVEINTVKVELEEDCTDDSDGSESHNE
ncbi:unnamed protein product [Leptidea sinapis]|uniref:MADF domain-containing protein n=1 Tax=Leptidea sinapis TaxID=189913 RepID=A0A5E4QUP1_9NEOP|nr:unnamed protein product [Leptidea sinapis]